MTAVRLQTPPRPTPVARSGRRDGRRPGAFDRHHGTVALYALAGGGLLIAFAMWWLYFTSPAHTLLATTHQAHRRRFLWAYGHFPVFASAAAEGAGLAAYAEHLSDRTGTSSAGAAMAVTVPAAVFVITVRAAARPAAAPAAGGRGRSRSGTGHRRGR
ncbi:Low temperature requirement protein LtrA OS=Streptomyces glaucescens OX=1907 GN=SGLAU_14575 PE=4 SV=1 [Streptomyces glaucescens]